MTKAAALTLLFYVGAYSDTWLFDTPICTGLGDRLGFVVSLSALARLNDNATVYMEWCTDPKRAVLANPRHMVFIPGWVGYDYPLERVFERFTLPGNVRFGAPPGGYKLVTSHWQAPAIEGIPLTRTLYFKALRMGEVGDADHEQAYLEAGAELRSRRNEQGEPYVVVHFRCPDSNTYNSGDAGRYCTRRVIRRLHRAGVGMRVITNDYNLTGMWLEGLEGFEVLSGGDALGDMQVILGASGIVQHAEAGWSAFTSVPAMAKQIPLINTYKGVREHRYDFFQHYGDLPGEFFSCEGAKLFYRSLLFKSKG